MGSTAAKIQQGGAGSNDDDLLLWSPEVVARKLGIAKRTFEQWRASEKFPGPDFRIGNKVIRWKPETVKRWIAENPG